MTVQQLYDFAKEKGVEDYDITLRFRDYIGTLSGSYFLYNCDIDIYSDKKILEL